MSAYAYIANTSPEAPKPTFEHEPSDDEIAFEESMRKGYLTEHESIYFGSKQFDLEEVPIRVE